MLPHLLLKDGQSRANGHTIYFDERRVCPDDGALVRRLVRRGGVELDEIYLECEHCDAEAVARVDCEGYK